MHRSSGHLVQIYTANSVAEAHVVASVLDAEGIPVSLNGIAHATMAWDHLVALGGIKVMVPRVCKDQAVFRLSDTNYDPPVWQSRNFWHQRWINAPSAIIGVLFGTVFPPWIRAGGLFYAVTFVISVAGFLLLGLETVSRLITMVLFR